MKLIQKLNKKKTDIISIVVSVLLSIFLIYIFSNSFKFGVLIFLFILFNFLFLMSGKLSFNNIVFLLLFCSILCPPIYFKSLPALRPELILILMAWALFILGKIAKKKNIIIKLTSVNKWFLFFGVCIMLSILYAFVVKGMPPIRGDFFEIAKLIEYFLIFALVVNLTIKKENFRKYYALLVCLLLMSAIVGITQHFNLFNINQTISHYYAPTQIEGLLIQGRITGSTANPNNFSLLMSIGAFFALIGILWNKKVTTKLLLIIPFFIFFYSIILTLSRSGLLCLIVGSLFILLVKYFRESKFRNKTKKILIISFIIFILISIFISIAPLELFSRLNLAIKPGLEGSFYYRLIKWEDAIDAWKQSPIFGLGPEKSTSPSSVDNEWLLILRRYGVIGFLIFFMWSWKFYRGIDKIQKGNESFLSFKIFSISLEASLVAIGIYMISAGFYHFLQGMPILMTIAGLVYSQENFKKIKIK